MPRQPSVLCVFDVIFFRIGSPFRSHSDPPPVSHPTPATRQYTPPLSWIPLLRLFAPTVSRWRIPSAFERFSDQSLPWVHFRRRLLPMRRGTVVLLLLLISAAYTARATSVVNDDDDDPFDDFFEDESDDDARVRQQWAASVEEVATRQTARPSASHDLPEEERVLHESDGIAKFFAAAHYRQRRHRFTTLAVECDPTNPCSGHGRCTTGSLCTCDHDAQKGFWSGPQCQDCDVGYAGPECKKQCAGGSCNVCNTHGICNMGTGGDASCSCYNSNAQGHWTGAECSQCSPGWFGTECTKSCPGTDVGPACYGRGRCNDQDDGSCVCDPGWGSGSGCRECDEAHWGRGCLNSCAGTLSDGVTPCSGHGRCFNGTTGNGTCQCFSGSHYGTATCGVKCPDDCRGFGICREGADHD